MILPGKYLSQDRALLNVGAKILTHLEEPRSVSELWECLRSNRLQDSEITSLSFDWFVLALNLLYTLSAVDFRDGLVRSQTSR